MRTPVLENRLIIPMFKTKIQLNFSFQRNESIECDEMAFSASSVLMTNDDDSQNQMSLVNNKTCYDVGFHYFEVFSLNME